MSRWLSLPNVIVGALVLGGCGSSEPTRAPEPEAKPAAAEDIDVEIPTVEHTLDPKAGDPSVPAELGGPGFTGEGWTTNLRVSSLGNLDAPQGGEIIEALPDWPVTLRFAGKDYNTWYNYHWRSMMLMSLLDLDPVTLEPVPALATHWKRNEDDTVFQFRLDPRATWSDGTPITTKDFVETYDLLTDESILDPSAYVTWGKFEKPTAVSKYILEVRVKEATWLNFLLFVEAFYPFPAHQIGDLKG
ncbi:MAG: ABC transporter substrate-binding protein [Myxococcota bacterium]